MIASSVSPVDRTAPAEPADGAQRLDAPPALDTDPPVSSLMSATSGLDAVLVADRGRIVGIVTATDLLRSLASEHPTPTADAAVRISP